MKRILRATALVMGLTAASAAAGEEVVLRGVSSLPTNNSITKIFVDYINLVNEKGAGVVRIELIGGPEAIPTQQQDTALRNGVIDIQGGPAGYYTGVVPEAEALTGASVTASEARANGAFATLNEVWRDRLGAELLAWIGAGTQYNIFLREVPKLDADGNIRFEGMRLRSTGTYRDWFDALGASGVILQQSELFTALERGMVDGFGFISFVSEAGLNRLIRARVDPPVWQGTPVVMVNGARYDQLSPETKQILQDAAVAIETQVAETLADRITEEDARLAADGVEFIELTGESRAAYVETAFSVIWDKLERDVPDFAAHIKPLMYPAR